MCSCHLLIKCPQLLIFAWKYITIFRHNYNVVSMKNYYYIKELSIDDCALLYGYMISNIKYVKKNYVTIQK